MRSSCEGRVAPEWKWHFLQTLRDATERGGHDSDGRFVNETSVKSQRPMSIKKMALNIENFRCPFNFVLILS